MNNDNLNNVNIKKDFDTLASATKEKVQETAHHLAEEVKSTSNSIKETTSALKDQLVDKASDLTHKISEKCCDSSEKAVQCMKEKPIHAAVGFSIFGFILGSYLSRRKDK